MPATQVIKNRNVEEEKLELYMQIGQGYLAMKEGRESSIEEVKKRIEQRRARYEQGSVL